MLGSTRLSAPGVRKWTEAGGRTAAGAEPGPVGPAGPGSDDDRAGPGRGVVSPGVRRENERTPRSVRSRGHRGTP
jgi:hypothetical protein